MSGTPDYSDEYVMLRDREKLQENAAALRALFNWHHANPNSAMHDYHRKVRAMTSKEKLAEVKRINDEIRSKTLALIEEKTDESVLEAFGGADKLLAATEEKERRDKNAKARARMPAIREKALLSFIESEAEGRNFADAGNRAHAAVDRAVDIKTIRELWLKPLIASGVCKIPPPKPRRSK